MTPKPMHIVWLKRDLRVTDHAPLAEAARRGPVLPLYVVEPELWRQPDASGRQYAFLAECVATLARDLARLRAPLVVRVGEMVMVLDALAADRPIAALWSHQEIGNGWTYARDKAVAAWARGRGIPWHEAPTGGVVRRLPTRDGWAARWERRMRQPVEPPPTAITAITPALPSEALPTAEALGLTPDDCPGRQRGGRDAAMADLASFLEARGRDYRFEMSSPLTADMACSRLSAHLAFGTLSIREVAQATRARFAALDAEPPTAERRAWAKSLVSFSGRLHWHCHFIQKLEDAPAIEHRNLHRAYDGLRPDNLPPGSPEAARFAAWATGHTGLPFLDACMRSLIATGWINFRMRAMLVAVASYQLWLPWRPTGLHLARLFTDYEPGIHWPQVQMQSGTTGINTVRMYNPVKQGYDQDPTGAFVRRWVPELADLPDHAIHEPWRWPDVRSIASESYPDPIVDHEAAARIARERVWGVRRGTAYHTAADSIQEQHGSRRSGMTQVGRRKTASPTRPRTKARRHSAAQTEMDV